MSMVPNPTATATSNAGGATRACPGAASIERGEKSPATPANSAISDSEMVRRRVVHSPPSGRSSKERGSIGGGISGTQAPAPRITYDNLHPPEGVSLLLTAV